MLHTSLVVLLLGLMAPTQESPPSTPARTTLVRGTAIELRLARTVTSKKLHAGEAVEFQVVQDVRVGDLVAIARGAMAQGKVAELQPSRMKGREGYARIEIERVALITGETAPLSASLAKRGEGDPLTGQKVKEAAAETFGMALVVMPIVLLQKGGEAYLAKGTRVSAVIDRDTEIDLVVLRQAQSKVPGPYAGPPVVYFFRDWDAEAAEKRFSLLCGKGRIARIPDGRYLRLELPPGRYTFHSDMKENPLTLELRPAQELYVRVFTEGTWPFTRGNLERVEAAQGEERVYSLDPLDPVKMGDIARISRDCSVR